MEKIKVIHAKTREDLESLRQLDKEGKLMNGAINPTPEQIKADEEQEKAVEMKPEPAVEYEGEISDRTEHVPMLSNDYANAVADEAARRQAEKLGFTPEQMKYVGGSSTLPPRK